MDEIERLQTEIKQREARIAALLADRASKRASDLASFEAMDAEDRRELYEHSPDTFRRYMNLVRDRNERQLMGGGAWREAVR